MYLRFRAKYYNTETEKTEYGFFWTADFLQKNGNLQTIDDERLNALICFFDHELPIPEYYQDEKNRQKSKSTTSWFKDSATMFIKSMNELAAILEKYNIEVERIHAKKLPGKVIYEDDFQVTIIPFRDLGKNVL